MCKYNQLRENITEQSHFHAELFYHLVNALVGYYSLKTKLNKESSILQTILRSSNVLKK